MKPLIIIRFDRDVDYERVREAETYLHNVSKEGGVMQDYVFMVIQGDGYSIRVHYFTKPFVLLFKKIKAWVFLRIRKKKKFSNTSVIM